MKEVAERLLKDGDLVAGIAVRLGRLTNVGFLSELSALRTELAANSPTAPTVAAVQKSLNEAVADIAPITLSDLRDGWTPASSHSIRKHGVFFYAAFSALVMIACAYGTLLYASGALIHASLLDVQKGKPNERVAKLFSFVVDDRLMKAVTSGDPSIFVDVYTKMFYEAKTADDMLRTFGPDAGEENIVRRIGRYLSGAVSSTPVAPTTSAPPGYATTSTPPPPVASPQSLPPSTTPPSTAPPSSPATSPLTSAPFVQFAAPTTSGGLDTFAQRWNALKTFHSIAELQATLHYSDATVTKMLRELHVGLSFLGLLVLPALYGLLGTCVFYLRRFVDPNTPNPQWGPTIFRTVLGAIVGVIAVSMFSQSNTSLTDSTFASPTIFGVAFLAGFSMDLFLKLIDQTSNRILGGRSK